MPCQLFFTTRGWDGTATVSDMTLELLADQYWDTLCRIAPTTATLRGNHDYDEHLPRFDDEWRSEMATRLTGIIDAARELDVQQLSTQDRITRELIIHQAESTRLGNVESSYLLAGIDPFTGPHTVLLSHTRQYTVQNIDQANALLRRYEKIPVFLVEALAMHRRNVGSGMPPAAASTTRVLSQLDRYLDSDLTDDPFLVLKVPGDGTRWRERVERLVTEVIRPAVSDYRDGIRDDVAPASRADDEAGLSWIDDGESLYARLIERYVQTTASAQEIHDIGQDWATGINAEEFVEIGAKTLGARTLPKLFERLASDPQLKFESEDHMLRHARRALERAWAVVDDWFNHRPAAPCQVLPVPNAIAPAMPQAYYMQPPLDGSRPGTYYLNTYKPAERDLPEYESIHFHEGVPGHHFDRSLAAELDGIPTFRRFAMVYAHTEGWGLYSERLADEMGLYSSDISRLGMVSADAWRAARLVTDTGIHALGWSRQQAIDFMKKWTPVGQLTIEQEIDRYISMPGQALSYKMGQLEILRLRKHASEKMGSAFDIRGFHDAMLVNGAMPLPMLQVAVEDWMISAA